MNSYLGFNLSPSAVSAPQQQWQKVAGNQNQSSIFGSKPGDIAAPPSIYNQVAGVYSGLPNLTQEAGGVINQELQGQLSSSTLRNISDYAAAHGVAAGVTGGNIPNDVGMALLGTTTEQLQHQGSQDYLAFLGGVGQTQLDPNLLTSIATQNSLWNAAPDPVASSEYMIGLSMAGAPRGGGGTSIMPSGGWDNPYTSANSEKNNFTNDPAYAFGYTGGKSPIAYGPGGGPSYSSSSDISNNDINQMMADFTAQNDSSYYQ